MASIEAIFYFCAHSSGSLLQGTTAANSTAVGLTPRNWSCCRSRKMVVRRKIARSRIVPTRKRRIGRKLIVLPHCCRDFQRDCRLPPQYRFAHFVPLVTIPPSLQRGLVWWFDQAATIGH